MINLQELLGKVKVTREMEYSPVNYMMAVLEKYVQGEYDQPKLRSEFKDQTVSAQFFFFHMPEGEIKANQRIFKQEFDFADAVGSLIRESYVMSDEELKEKLAVEMERYLAARSEAKAE